MLTAKPNMKSFVNKKSTLLICLLLLVSSSVFYWLPKAQIKQALKKSISESLPYEIRNAVGESGSNKIYDDVINFLLPLYEKDINGNLQTSKNLFTRNCKATLPRKQEGGFANTSEQLDLNAQLMDISLNVNCETRWGYLLGSALPISVLFAFIISRLPKPFSHQRTLLINKLIQCNYSQNEALSATQLLDLIPPLAENQLETLELLHDSNNRNFKSLLQLSLEYPIHKLNSTQLLWLKQALQSHSFNEAFQIASSEDTLIINLHDYTVSVHGWSFALSKTPLFYYAWYALLRQEGEGWYKNPPSNRPDINEGSRIANLMAKHHGHAKAINDLEDNGLRSKILDQNRSKLKDEITLILGPNLATPYLIESRKDEEFDQSNYRLTLNSDKIIINL